MATKKNTENKMDKATAITAPTKAASVVKFPAIGTGSIVTIDPSKVRSFDDVGLGTGLWPDDIQINMKDMLGQEIIVADAKLGLKGVIAGKETEYGVIRCYTEEGFKFLPVGEADFDDNYVTVEPGSFFTTATGGIVAYRQISAALQGGLLPLKSFVSQSESKTKGMEGYYYFGKKA